MYILLTISELILMYQVEVLIILGTDLLMIGSMW